MERSSSRAGHNIINNRVSHRRQVRLRTMACLSGLLHNRRSSPVAGSATPARACLPLPKTTTTQVRITLRLGDKTTQARCNIILVITRKAHHRACNIILRAITSSSSNSNNNIISSNNSNTRANSNSNSHSRDNSNQDSKLTAPPHLPIKCTLHPVPKAVSVLQAGCTITAEPRSRNTRVSFTPCCKRYLDEIVEWIEGIPSFPETQVGED